MGHVQAAPVQSDHRNSLQKGRDDNMACGVQAAMLVAAMVWIWTLIWYAPYVVFAKLTMGVTASLGTQPVAAGKGLQIALYTAMGGVCNPHFAAVFTFFICPPQQPSQHEPMKIAHLGMGTCSCGWDELGQPTECWCMRLVGIPRRLQQAHCL